MDIASPSTEGTWLTSPETQTLQLSIHSYASRAFNHYGTAKARGLLEIVATLHNVMEWVKSDYYQREQSLFIGIHPGGMNRLCSVY